jgi:uncharacterized protein DUF547
MNKYLILLFFTVLPFQIPTDASAADTTPGPFDQTHTLYSNVVREYVKDGSVDYRGIKSNPDDLKNYLDQTSTITKGEFDKWTRDQQLAFLINVYNAGTLDLIQENYPVVSIKDIAEDSGGPWEQPIVGLFGDKITLNALENEVIRKNYPEPRIHFALVCAAKGCPVLIDKPYLGETLNEQLEAQTRVFLSDTRNNSIDTANKTLHLSPLFDWYSEDFVKESGSVARFVNPYFDGKAGSDFKIEYTSYDWTLNGIQ